MLWEKKKHLTKYRTKVRIYSEAKGAFNLHVKMFRKQEPCRSLPMR